MNHQHSLFYKGLYQLKIVSIPFPGKLCINTCIVIDVWICLEYHKFRFFQTTLYTYLLHAVGVSIWEQELDGGGVHAKNTRGILSSGINKDCGYDGAVYNKRIV